MVLVEFMRCLWKMLVQLARVERGNIEVVSGRTPWGEHKIPLQG